MLSLHIYSSFALIDLPQAPTNLQNPRPDDTYQSRSITSTHESDQDIIVASLRSEKLSRNRYPGQAAEAHDRV